MVLFCIFLVHSFKLILEIFTEHLPNHIQYTVIEKFINSIPKTQTKFQFQDRDKTIIIMITASKV